MSTLPPKTSPSTGYTHVAAPALAALLAAGIPVGALLGGGTLQWKDTLALYAPLRSEVVVALRDLSLPLWNPCEAMGMPLFAQMLHGVLHPVSVLAALLAPRASLDTLAVVYVALAAAGTTLLARQLGRSAAASVLAGIAFGTSGYVLSMTANFMYLVGAATAPWAVSGLMTASSSRGGFVLAAFGTTATLFAGDPQWAAVAAALGLMLAAVVHGGRAVSRAFTAMVIGTLIASVQIVPTLLFWMETARGAGVLGGGRTEWALAPWRLVELMTPGFFSGRPGVSLVAPVYQWLGHPGNRYVIPFSASVFVGATLLALAAIGSVNGRRGRVLGSTALLCIWMALGDTLGADQLMRYVPIWGSFRYAEKMVGPLTLCLALLGAHGADRLATAPLKRMQVAFILAFALLAAGAALAVHYWGWITAGAAGVPGAKALAREQLPRGLAHASLAFGALAGLLIAARYERVRTLLVPLLAGLVLAEGTAAAPFAIHVGAPGVRDGAPLRGLAQEVLLPRVIHPVPVARGLGPKSLDESDRLAFVESRMGLPSYNAAVRLDSFDGYSGLMPRRYKSLDEALARAFGEQRWLAMRRYSVTHVVLPPLVPPALGDRVTLALEDAVQSAVAVGPWVSIYQVPHRPRAFFAETSVSVDSDQEALHRVIGILRDGKTDVVVQGKVPAILAAGVVESLERGPGWLRIDAASSGETLLIINEAFWPGWRATVDGHPVEIMCADALVRAVRWPPGTHRLEMNYDPQEVRLGLILSALGIAAMIAALRLLAW